jgi:hypothetical protein
MENQLARAVDNTLVTKNLALRVRRGMIISSILNAEKGETAAHHLGNEVPIPTSSRYGNLKVHKAMGRAQTLLQRVRGIQAIQVDSMNSTGKPKAWIR